MKRKKLLCKIDDMEIVINELSRDLFAVRTKPKFKKGDIVQCMPYMTNELCMGEIITSSIQNTTGSSCVYRYDVLVGEKLESFIESEMAPRVVKNDK